MLNGQRDEIGEGRFAHLDRRRRRPGTEEAPNRRSHTPDAVRQDARHLAGADEVLPLAEDLRTEECPATELLAEGSAPFVIRAIGR